MKKNSTRLMLILLTFVMLFATVSAGNCVFAADEETEVITETQSITLQRTVSSEPITLSKKKVYGASYKFNGSYGNQLSGLSREIYDSMVSQYITKRVGGSYNYKIKTPVAAAGRKYNSVKNAISNSLGEAVQCAMDAFLYDYPQAFWIFVFGTSYELEMVGSDSIGWAGTVRNIYLEPVEILIKGKKGSSYIKTFDNAVKEDVKFLKEKIDQFGYDIYNKYEVATLIHDFICVNAYYREAYYDNAVYCAAPFFLSDCGFVCEGYAETFKILCEEFDIPCVLVSGDAGGAHMWNYVQMDDGKWYLVDATWDDQGSEIYDNYCIVSAYEKGFSGTISSERTPDGDFNAAKIMSFVYPELSTTPFVNHTHQWDTKYTTDKAATCSQKGSKSIHCKTCNATKQKQDIPKTAHKYKTGSVKIKATTKADGAYNTTCTVCGKNGTSAISRIDKITLSTTSYTYNGKARKPSVTVKDKKGNTLKADTHYTVSYAKGRKAIGTYAVTVTFKGKYSGTSTVKFTIKPAVTDKVTAKSTKTAITLKWNAVTGATGYRVYCYNEKTKKYESVASSLKTTTYTLKKLKTAKTYKFKVKAYTKKGSTTIWGSNSKVYTFSTAPSTPALTVTSTKKGVAQLSWKNVSGESNYEVYYSTSKDSGFKKVGTCKADITTATVSNLVSKKVYYFRVRATIKAPDATAYGSYQTVAVKIK